MASCNCSDLFLSLAGGFALGVAGISFIAPASAVNNDQVERSVTVETLNNDQHGEIEKR